MSDNENKITSMASGLLKNPNVLPGAAAVVGGGALLSGLFGRRTKTDPETGEMQKEGILNWRTLIGGVLGVTAFTMIARRNGFEPAALKMITDKLHLGGRGV